VRALATALLVCSAILCGNVVACRPAARGESATGPVSKIAGAVDQDGIRRGTAEEPIWLALDGFGTKVQIPRGWAWAHKGATVAGIARDARAAWVLSGSWTKADAIETLNRARAELRLETGPADRGSQEAVGNGLHFLRQDYERASVGGHPARGVALVADSPIGNGFLVFLGYALQEDTRLGDDLRSTVTSISKE
jgi:hypothetical protein